MDTSYFYEVALAVATGPTVSTSWTNYPNNERFDIPAVHNEQRPILQAWLSSLNSAVATGAAPWGAIKSNWISFLSATSNAPSVVLAPNRRPTAASNRFFAARDHRRSVQESVWRMFDEAALGVTGVRTWPFRPGAILGHIVDGDCETSMFSLMLDSGRERRFKSVWSAMMSFLVYCAEENYSLEEMGLRLPAETYQELRVIVQHSYAGRQLGFRSDDGIENFLDGFRADDGIENFLDRALTDTNATPETSPLLWWTVVLVRSSVEPGPADDFISRGRFISNILPMDLDIEQRLEGIYRFGRLLFLSIALDMWQPSPGFREQVEDDMCSEDWRDCDTPAWRSLREHLETTFRNYIDQAGGTAMSHIVLLRNQLQELSSVHPSIPSPIQYYTFGDEYEEN